MDLIFIFAMEEEAKYSIEENNYELICDFPFKVYQNKYSLIVICGIGISRSARCIGWLYEKYKPKKIINIGLAGSWNNKHNILDEFYIDKSFYSMADVSSVSNYSYGQIPRGEKFYSSNIKNILNMKECNISSSDIFVNSMDIVDNCIEKLNDKNIYLFDMECTSIMHSCFELKIECCAIKIISDILGRKNSNEDQFEESLEKGSKKISKIISNLVKEMRG